VKASQLSLLLEKIAIPHNQNILIVGPPGIGKTDIVKQACQNANAKLIISHPVVSDPTDYKGLPFPDGESAKFLPFGELLSLIKAEKKTVFFLDDLGQAPASVQAAAMQLLLERRINGHHVSEYVTFIAATNRVQDRAGVTGILEPVKSRFASIIELEFDLNEWAKWAFKHNMPTELIAFARFRPELMFDFAPTKEIKNYPCPRTVAKVGELLNIGIPKEIEFETIQGAAGEGFAAEFIAFLQIYRNLPNPDLIIMNPDKADVPDPETPEGLATIYALCGALANKANDVNFENILRYGKRLPADFGILLVKDAVMKNNRLTDTRAFAEWASENSGIVL